MPLPCREYNDYKDDEHALAKSKIEMRIVNPQRHLQKYKKIMNFGSHNVLKTLLRLSNRRDTSKYSSPGLALIYRADKYPLNIHESEFSLSSQ